MTEIAIRAQGLSKKYKLGATATQHDSIRDLIVSGAKGLLGRKDDGQDKEFWALRNASFEIARGENVGIIGLNGAGKSTLLKVLSQIVTPTEGSADITGRLGALLEVGTGFHQELTGRENVYLYGSILGMRRTEVETKFNQILEFSEIGKFIDTPVKRYSSGMYVRLAFAVAAHLEPDILLLDEVLAVGDFAFQKKCMDFARALEQRGSTILFVSHNMFSIKSFCPRVIYLRQGEVIYDGPTDAGLKMYEADSRLAVSPWFHQEGADAPAITFTDITQTDEQGHEKTVFDFGERMREISRITPDPASRFPYRLQPKRRCTLLLVLHGRRWTVFLGSPWRRRNRAANLPAKPGGRHVHHYGHCARKGQLTYVPTGTRIPHSAPRLRIKHLRGLSLSR
jgi:lipopolysaccharide transport system ATP-binding protein